MNALPKDYEWIMRGDFRMIEKPEDKFYDCRRVINYLEKFATKELLNILQVSNNFIYQGRPRCSWDNGQRGEGRRFVRLDMFYTPTHSRLNIHLTSYYMNEYSVSVDHSSVHLELHIGGSEMRITTFKWNVSCLKGEIADKLEEMYEQLPGDASFFHKMRNVSRYYRQIFK